MTNRTATRAPSAQSARQTAADLLWTARSEPTDLAIDHTVWALCLVPDCRAARMQRIDLLIEAGDFDEARDALAAERLRRPFSWSIALRRARVLYHRHAIDEAQAAIRFVLRDRPKHAGALRLAALISRERGDVNDALAYLVRASAARPRKTENTTLLVEVALELGQSDLAAAAIQSLASPPPALQAEVFAATGRRIDARLHLERALRDEPNPAEQDAILCTLIKLVDSDGGVLDPLRWSIRRTHPKAVLAYAAALLSRGRARSALRLARWSARCTDNPDRRLDAMVLIAASASALGKADRASAAAGTVQALVRTPRQRQRVAELWRRAIAGQTITAIRTGQESDHPAPAGMLATLLGRSVEVIQRNLESDHPLTNARRSTLERHLRLGLQTMDATHMPLRHAQPARRAA